MRKAKHYPRISQAIWLLASIFVLTIIVFLIYLLAFIILNKKDMILALKYISGHPELNGFFNLITFSIILIWGYKRAKTTFGKIFPFKPVPLTLFVPIVLTIIGLGIILSDVDNLLRIVLHTPVNHNSSLFKLVNGGSSPWLALITLSVIAPLTEEFLFRGFILTGFLNNYSVKTSIVLSAILFGAFHLDLYQSVSATIIGLLFGWLLVKTRSLWLCIFGHALNNAIPLVCIRLFHLEIPGFTVSFNNQTVFQPMWFDIIGFITLSLGLWLLLGKLKLKQLTLPDELRREGDQIGIAAKLDENEAIQV